MEKIVAAAATRGKVVGMEEEIQRGGGRVHQKMVVVVTSMIRIVEMVVPMMIEE